MPARCISLPVFDNYGIEIPDASWTWNDMLSLAEKLTGTDPVTGKQTYGVQLDSMDNANNSFFNYQMIASAYDAKVFQYGKTVEDSTVNFVNEKTENSGTVSVSAFSLEYYGAYCDGTVDNSIGIFPGGFYQWSGKRKNTELFPNRLLSSEYYYRRKCNFDVSGSFTGRWRIAECILKFYYRA